MKMSYEPIKNVASDRSEEEPKKKQNNSFYILCSAQKRKHTIFNILLNKISKKEAHLRKTSSVPVDSHRKNNM